MQLLTAIDMGQRVLHTGKLNVTLNKESKTELYLSVAALELNGNPFSEHSVTVPRCLIRLAELILL